MMQVYEQWDCFRGAGPWVYSTRSGQDRQLHDGWFAGFTSNLLCIVWVGYERLQCIHLSGASIARHLGGIHEAGRCPAQLFRCKVLQPALRSGATLHKIKPPGRLLLPACPDDYLLSFIGRYPATQTCEQGAADHRNVSRSFLVWNPTRAPPPVSNQKD